MCSVGPYPGLFFCKGWMGMGTTLSTLSNLAIYIGLVVVGAFLGSR